MGYVTQVEAVQDAVRRAKLYGYDWHVIEIHDEEIGPTHTAVSLHYFKTHPKARSLYCAKAPELEPFNVSRWSRFVKWLKKAPKQLIQIFTPNTTNQ